MKSNRDKLIAGLILALLFALLAGPAWCHTISGSATDTLTIKSQVKYVAIGTTDEDVFVTTVDFGGNHVDSFTVHRGGALTFGTNQIEKVIFNPEGSTDITIVQGVDRQPLISGYFNQLIEQGNQPEPRTWSTYELIVNLADSDTSSATETTEGMAAGVNCMGARGLLLYLDWDTATNNRDSGTDDFEIRPKFNINSTDSAFAQEWGETDGMNVFAFDGEDKLTIDVSDFSDGVCTMFIPTPSVVVGYFYLDLILPTHYDLQGFDSYLVVVW